MGLVLDIVPNHMSDAASNLWWKDVLENGPSSPYAYYFDIEWDPPSHSRGEKMVWPILGAPYAEVLERQELTLTFSEEGFAIRYFERALPIDPSTYGRFSPVCRKPRNWKNSSNRYRQAPPPTPMRSAFDAGRPRN